MAVIKTWNATALTGGAVRALDAIPTASLTDGDRAFVVASGTIYYYEFDATGTAAESSPSVMRPDDYSTAGNWILSRWYTQETNYNNNLFINSDFAVNQEAYAGGVITTGEYGHDMMKSISSASYTVSGGALTMVSGTLGQRNDDLIAVDGEAVTISVESGSLTIGATAGAAATTITVGNPYSWTFDESGTAFVTITAATAAKGIKIEKGSTATGYVDPEPRSEESRCFWYYRKLSGNTGGVGAYSDANTKALIVPISGGMGTISATINNVVVTPCSGTSASSATYSSIVQDSLETVVIIVTHVAGISEGTIWGLGVSGYIELDARY
jgi:hypothetical protein